MRDYDHYSILLLHSPVILYLLNFVHVPSK